MRVEVYFNLHKHLFSVRSASSGRVILHTDRVHIRNPEFVVRQGGRQRVLKERKKNVHAFVRGNITVFDDFDPDYNGYSLVSYNPYKHDTFVDVHDVTPVRKAKRAVLQLEPRWSSVFMRPYVYVEGASSC